MNQLFDKGRDGFGLAQIDWDTGVIKAALVRGYTPNFSTHQFLSDVTGAGGVIVATATLTTNISDGAGAMQAANLAFASVPAGAAIQHLVIYQASAPPGGVDLAATAQRLIGIIDGKTRFTIASISALNATAAAVDPLPTPIPSGVAATRISGTGPATITTSAIAAVGARSIACTALSAATVVNDVYEVPTELAGANNGLPITPNGNNIAFTFDTGANKIFKL
jgi:hypothetical protein